MTTLNACDYSYPAQNVSLEQFAKDLAAAGIRVVQRYLFVGGKGITVAERAALLAEGIGIAYGYEGYASNWRGGAVQGARDGAAAVACLNTLHAAHPFRNKRAITVKMAIDEDASGLGMLPTAKAYVKAAHKVLRKAGYGGARCYGSFAVVEYLRQPGAFQTYAWSPSGAVSKRTALYQWKNGQTLAGATVDFDELIDASALGAEWPAGNDPKENTVSIVNAIRVLRAVILGGSYATPALKKKYPTMVNEQGLLRTVAQLVKDRKQDAHQIADLSARVKALETASTPKAHHAAEAKEAQQ